MEPAGSSDPSTCAEGEEDRVQGTALDFGEFRVLKFRRENQTILEFSGLAGGALAREVERLASHCRGNLGLDFSEMQGLSPALVPALERARKRTAAHGRALFLCNP
ncbi:MAG: hypothetical protein ACRD2T_06295, partial [Thermoanaerobaculia bacterium]